MNDPARQIRFTLFVDDEQVHEAWTPETDVDTIAREQAALSSAAWNAGKDYRLEIFDPTLPPDFATMRIGTSPKGMANPIEVPLEGLDDVVTSDYLGRVGVRDYFEATRKPKDDA